MKIKIKEETEFNKMFRDHAKKPQTPDINENVKTRGKK
jgi:hypothetical protein